MDRKELEEGASFEIEGPDEDGFAWICSAAPDGRWRHNLGPAGAAAEAMARWLDENDFGDRGFYVMRYSV